MSQTSKKAHFEQIRSQLDEILSHRIMILDGAMGTMIQAYDFSEEQFRGQKFKDWPSAVKGNNDMLSLTQPAAIIEIHRAYFAAGADIVEARILDINSILAWRALILR